MGLTHFCQNYAYSGISRGTYQYAVKERRCLRRGRSAIAVMHLRLCSCRLARTRRELVALHVFVSTSQRRFLSLHAWLVSIYWDKDSRISHSFSHLASLTRVFPIINHLCHALSESISFSSPLLPLLHILFISEFRNYRDLSLITHYYFDSRFT